MKNCEFFYHPMFAIYDCGADYLTREKHRLVVIANRKLMMIWTKCPLLRGSLKIFLKSK